MRLHVRYEADIWVEVDTDEEDVLSVVVDELTMAMPVDVVDDDGAAVAERTRARGIAENPVIGPAGTTDLDLSEREASAVDHP